MVKIKPFFAALLMFFVSAYFMLFASSYQLDTPFVKANEEKAYLRIINENTCLYKTATPSSDITDIYFVLPQTYFAEILADVSEQFYQVSFNGINGFVLKTDAQRVYSTPVTPFPQNITFKIQGVANAIVRSAPDTGLGEYLGIIPFNAVSVVYFGSINGQEAMNGLGTTWYYAKYTSFEQGELRGYVYSPLTTSLPAIPPNTEVVLTTPPDNTEFFPPELDDPTSLLLIAVLSLPALILLYMLFKPQRKGKTKRTAPKQFSHPNLLPASAPNYVQMLEYNQAKNREPTDEFDF